MNLNFKALHDFREACAKADLGDVRQSGRFKVWCRVSFHAPNGDAFEDTLVTLLFDGYEQGRIDIDEMGELTVEDFHLRFSPDFQSFTFDTDNDTLVVEGSSPKMGGDYMVRMHPRVDHGPGLNGVSP